MLIETDRYSGTFLFIFPVGFTFVRPHIYMASEQGLHFKAKEISELEHGQLSFHTSHNLKSIGLTDQ